MDKGAKYMMSITRQQHKIYNSNWVKTHQKLTTSNLMTFLMIFETIGNKQLMLSIEKLLSSKIKAFMKANGLVIKM